MTMKNVAFATKIRQLNTFSLNIVLPVNSALNITFGFPQPHSIPRMFGNWLQEFGRILKPLVLLGTVATCWSLWLCINVLVFGLC